MYTLQFTKLDVEHLVKQYMLYVSVFNCVDVDFDDELLNEKIKDLQNYINDRIGDKNVSK